jgi:hypothetical protein
MFIRFVTLNMDPESQVSAGIFTVAYDVLRTGKLCDYEREELKDLLLWFDKNLDAPTRFCRSRRPNAQSKAICWFRPTAKEHLEVMRRLA